MNRLLLTALWAVMASAHADEAAVLDKDTYESIKRQAIDPYVFVRNAYAQKRSADVAK